MLDLHQLRVFARIAEAGSLSAAARLLGMPKSSVSRALARLEETAGAALVERSTRALRLTDAGHLLRRHAGRILDDVGEAENALAGLVGRPSGTLRVSVGHTFAAGPLAPMLAGFLARHPDLRLVPPSGPPVEVALAPVAFVLEPAVLRTMLLAGAGIGWLPVAGIPLRAFRRRTRGGVPVNAGR